MDSRRAWLVYGVAVFAYFSSVLQRTSLGVAGIDAQQRFVVSAAVLSTLAVVQVVVYAALQVPVGIALDRVGPRKLLIFGAVVMAAGQFLLAFTTVFPVALAARVAVGLGDAVTFNAALRLTAYWFSPRTATPLMQITGTIGQLGQLLSALPFALLIAAVGWQPAFVSAASVAALAAILLIIAVADAPAGAERPTAGRLSLVLRRLRITVARPGTWLAFWVHFTTVPGGAVVGLLWGMPFFEVGLGYSPTVAATLLMVPVVTAIIVGPIVGVATARWPRVRVGVAAVGIAMMIASWLVLVSWPGTPPMWFVILHIVIQGTGGPLSVIGFDLARSTNPSNSLGVANGVVNVGGFTSTFVGLFLVGFVLDLVDAGRVSGGAASSLYALDSFRIAFGAMQIIPTIGLLMLWHAYRSTRKRTALLRDRRRNRRALLGVE